MAKHGYRCPKCGQRGMDVTDTRPYGAFGVYRRRLCRCGHRITTYEVTEGEIFLLKNSDKMAQIKKARNAAAAFVQAMDELFKEIDDG